MHKLNSTNSLTMTKLPLAYVYSDIYTSNSKNIRVRQKLTT